MKRWVLAASCVVVLHACGFPGHPGTTPPPRPAPPSVTAAPPSTTEQQYCLIPEGCDENGRHYNGGAPVP